MGKHGDRRDVHLILLLRNWGQSRLSPVFVLGSVPSVPGFPPGFPPRIDCTPELHRGRWTQPRFDKFLSHRSQRGVGCLADNWGGIMLNQYGGWISRMRLRGVSVALTFVIVLGLGAVAAQSAPAPSFKVLYTFQGASDGGEPYAELVRDAAGNLYGTAITSGAFGWGVVFKVDRSRTETVLHSFGEEYTDGRTPYAGLVRERRAISMALPTRAAESDASTVVERCSSWIPKERKPCCTASPGGLPTAAFPTQACSGTKQGICTALRRPVALPATESCSR